jgi:hypothetical protein
MSSEQHDGGPPDGYAISKARRARHPCPALVAGRGQRWAIALTGNLHLAPNVSLSMGTPSLCAMWSANSASLLTSGCLGHDGWGLE